MRNRVLTRSAIVSLTLLAASAAVALAAGPLKWGTSYTPNRELNWKFASAYPSWLTDPVTTALDTNWDDPLTNNSKTARFSLSDAGLGRVIFSSSPTSPCNPTPNTVWLASACTAGHTRWTIYIHDFDKAPYLNWKWWDKAKGCPSGTCFRLRRTLIHEPIHLTGGGSVHSTAPPDITVFTKGQRSHSFPAGKTDKLLPCDEAGAQRAYDLRDMAGPYSPCLGPLKTQVLVGTAFQACQGLPVLVGGRLEVTASPYGKLNGNPIAGRVVDLELNGARVASVRGLSTNSGNNWAVWLAGTGAGARTYTASFAGDAPLNAAPAVTITVVWVPRAEC